MDVTSLGVLIWYMWISPALLKQQLVQIICNYIQLRCSLKPNWLHCQVLASPLDHCSITIECKHIPTHFGKHTSQCVHRDWCCSWWENLVQCASLNPLWLLICQMSGKALQYAVKELLCRLAMLQHQRDLPPSLQHAFSTWIGLLPLSVPYASYLTSRSEYQTMATQSAHTLLTMFTPHIEQQPSPFSCYWVVPMHLELKTAK